MSFLGQVLLQDVPGRQSEKGLVSLHYCLKCSDQGQMSFGRGGRYRGYAVTIFDDLAAAPDGLGTRARSCLPALVASLSEVEEFPGLHDCWELGIELPDAEIEGAGDLDEEIWPGVVHVARSKLGGWPSWDQDSQWPECSEGKRMGLVMQLDYELGRHSPWAAGGHAFLFGCESACRAREADLVIQTT
jgi:hypothetical protein